MVKPRRLTRAEKGDLLRSLSAHTRSAAETEIVVGTVPEGDDAGDAAARQFIIDEANRQMRRADRYSKPARARRWRPYGGDRA